MEKRFSRSPSRSPPWSRFSRSSSGSSSSSRSTSPSKKLYVDQEMQIKYDFLDALANSTLYYIQPGIYSKLGREGFIDYIIKQKTIDELHRDLVTNPDIYDSEISYIDKLYYKAERKLKRLKGQDKLVNRPAKNASFDDDEGNIYDPEKEREREELQKKSLKRVEKMVKEFEQSKEESNDWMKEYEGDQVAAEKWVKEYESSILDFFVTPMERQTIKTQIAKLIPEQKKFIVDVVMHSKALLGMKPEDQRKYVANFIKNMAKQYSKF